MLVITRGYILICISDMGLSENSVPLHPMVLLIIIPTKWLFHWGYTPFSDIPICADFLFFHAPKKENMLRKERAGHSADLRLG